MRLVAITLVAIMSLGLLPVQAAPFGSEDECADSLTAPDPCVHVDTTSTPGAPTNARKVIYVWLAAAECAPAFASECSGRPAHEPRALGFAGVIYEETNGQPGLQRLTDQARTADRMVLL